VVGDTAGLTAAAYHRGVACLQAPPTLLAQVDAAIGGKTGVNLPEGKNLVGAFHQPVAVLCDVDTLATLPEREYRAGLGEVAKYAFMGDADLSATLADDGAAAALLARDRAARDPLRLMRRDKAAAGGLTFVLPAPGGGPLERVDDPPAAAVDRALAAIGVAA